MLLSTIICPQYLRGGGLWSFPYMPIIPAVPLVVHRHIYALHHPPHHHIQREERQPHRHVIHTPLRQTPIFHGKKHYYCITLLLFLSATRCISVLWTLCIWTQKGHKPFVSILGGHLGHILGTPCSLGNRLIPPFRSFDHVHCKPSTSITSHLRTL